jgi:hypothetical protein
MLSGGVDSQAMLWCWVNSEIPFRAVTIRYTDHDGNILNLHDIANVESIANYYEMSVDYIDFNIINFLENFMLDYAIKYQCTSPQITTYMCMSEMICDGTVLFSGDFLSTMIGYDYTIFGLKRYADISKRNIIPFFLLHDPELTTALHQVHNKLSVKEFYGITDSENIWKQHAYLSKINAMNQIGIFLFPQKTKYSGFEKIKELYDTRYDLTTPHDRLKYAHMPSKRLFDVIFRYKLTEIIKYHDEIICLR